ncbi:MAG: hypothetical protein WCB27_16105 [Thermoguttaceae bacterium]
MPDEGNAKRITAEFNIVLFLFSFGVAFVKFIASEKAKNATVTGLLMSSALDAVLVVAVLLIGAFFVKEFWDRLISSLFPIRNLDYQEAIAILLIIGILFSR